jgi:hypothetical protein
VFCIGRFRVQKPTRIAVILIAYFHSFPSLQPHVGTESRIIPRPPPSVSCPINYSFIILSFDAVGCSVRQATDSIVK